MVDVRRATVEDADALAALNAVVQDLHVAERPELFLAADPSRVAAWFREVLEGDGARAWIAAVEGAPVGYLLAFHERRPANPFARERRWCEIDQVSVVEGARGRGVARALIDAAVVDAEACGLDRVELAAWSFNERARRAFERVGFVPMMVRFERDRRAGRES